MEKFSPLFKFLEKSIREKVPFKNIYCFFTEKIIELPIKINDVFDLKSVRVMHLNIYLIQVMFESLNSLINIIWIS